MSLDFYDTVKPKMIPDISDELIEKMRKQIKPVVQANGGRNNRFREVLIEGVGARNIAFNWDPKLGRVLKLYLGACDDREIMTFHTWAYYGFFKPTLAEVYACINQFVPDWSMVRYFWLDTGDLSLQSMLLGDYHMCRCHLFGDESKNVINQGFEADVDRIMVLDRANGSVKDTMAVLRSDSQSEADGVRTLAVRIRKASNDS